MMKKLVVTAAVGSVLMMGAAYANNDVTPQPVDQRLGNVEQSVEQTQQRGVQVDRSRLSAERVVGHYRGVDLDGGLRAGAMVYNDITRLTGEVTGNITVLMNNADIHALANEFNLSVVYQDNTTGIGQLNAAGHSDLAALLSDIQASDLVRSARLDILEARYSTDIIRR